MSARPMNTVVTERIDTTLLVKIDRPAVRNCVDRSTAAQLADAFRNFDRDEDLRVAILSGSEGHFCAGADLKAMSSEDPGQRNRMEVEGDGPMGPSRMELSKPVIAAVSGYCVAGGLELALWCDLRVADESAVFGVFCRRFGVPLIDGGTVRLPRLIGMSRAMDMILTGRPVDAREAYAMGLANRLAPRGEALSDALKLAAQIAQFPQTCMRGDRRSAYAQWGMSEADAIAHEFDIGMQAVNAGETVSGASRFRDGAGRHGHFGGDSK